MPLGTAYATYVGGLERRSRRTAFLRLVAHSWSIDSAPAIGVTGKLQIAVGPAALSRRAAGCCVT